MIVEKLIQRINEPRVKPKGELMAHCWFCNSDKKMDACISSKPLAYGNPFPVLDLTVRSKVISDGEVTQFVCRDCRSAILEAIANSKVASIQNVLSMEPI